MSASPAERSPRVREKIMVEQSVGFVRLPASRHRLRIQHSNLPGSSGTFGLDQIQLLAPADERSGVEKEVMPLIPVGDQPQPEPSEEQEFQPGPAGVPSLVDAFSGEQVPVPGRTITLTVPPAAARVHWRAA